MTNRSAFGIFFALWGTALSTGAGYAHHGVNGQFDTSQTIEVTGTVTNVRFVNPHAYVYFDVETDTGETEEWRCELNSGSLLKRKGWTTEMFADGTVLTILGAPARTEAHACYTETITFEDGTVVQRDSVLDDEGSVVAEQREPTLDDGTPNISGNWVAERRERGPRPERGPEGGTDRADAPRGERPPGPPPGPPSEPAGRPSFVLTDAGREAVAGYERDDMPRLHCSSTNIFEDWTFDQMVNKIVQTEDDIVMTYGFMDIMRTIHLDLDEHPADLTPSRAGHSIGHWEGEVLVVDTVGFAPGYVSAPPNPNGAAKNSDQLHVVERFSLSEDGKTLMRSYEGEDPLYLSESFSGEDSVGLTDAEFEPYDCEDLTNETL